MTQSLITKAKESGLSAKIDNKTIIMNNEKKLVQGTASGEINKK